MSKPEIKKQVKDAFDKAIADGYVSEYPDDQELWDKMDMILGGIPEIDMYSEQNYQYAQDVLIGLAY